MTTTATRITVYVPHISGVISGCTYWTPWLARTLAETRLPVADTRDQLDAKTHRRDGQPVFLTLAAARAWLRTRARAGEWDVRAVVVDLVEYYGHTLVFRANGAEWTSRHTRTGAIVYTYTVPERPAA